MEEAHHSHPGFVTFPFTSQFLFIPFPFQKFAGLDSFKSPIIFYIFFWCVPCLSPSQFPLACPHGWPSYKWFPCAEAISERVVPVWSAQLSVHVGSCCWLAQVPDRSHARTLSISAPIARQVCISICHPHLQSFTPLFFPVFSPIPHSVSLLHSPRFLPFALYLRRTSKIFYSFPTVEFRLINETYHLRSIPEVYKC